MGSSTVSSVAGLPGVTASALAGIEDVGSTVATSAAAAIAQGQSLLTSAEDQLGTTLGEASFSDIAGFATSVVQKVPPGQIQKALGGAAGIVSAAAAGAAIGSIIPGFGTVIGGVIGGIIGVFGDLLGGGAAPPPPEGEFRSTAEIYCFPGWSASAPSTPTDLSDNTPLMVLPCSWSDYRIHAYNYQRLASDDILTNYTGPGNFTFGVGWISPPGGGSNQSRNAAWWLANYVMGKSTVTQKWACSSSNKVGEPANILTATSTTGEAYHQLIQVLGGAANAAKSIALVRSWYDQPWSLNWKPTTKVSVGGQVVPFASSNGNVPIIQQNGSDPKPATFLEAFSDSAGQINASSPLDYTYYISNSFACPQPPPIVQPAAWGGIFDPSKQSQFPYRHCSLPDTILIMLSELACLVVTPSLVTPPPYGTVDNSGKPVSYVTPPGAAADMVAFHLMLAMAYRWSGGQQLDLANGPSKLGTTEGFNTKFPGSGGASRGDPINTRIQMHPNILRVLGLLQAKVQSRKAAAAAAQANAKAASVSHSAGAQFAYVNGQPVALRASSSLSSSASSQSSTASGGAMAVLAGVAAVGGIMFLKKRRRRR